MDEGINMKKKKYSGPKKEFHVEFFEDIRAHNRKLVSEKNELVDKLTFANDTIKKQNDIISELRNEIHLIKESIKDLQQNQKKEEIIPPKETIVENHIEDEIDNSFDDNSSEIYSQNTQNIQNIPQQNDIEIANNIQSQKVVYVNKPLRDLTPMELEIISHLRRGWNTYMDLQGKIGKGTSQRAIAVHFTAIRKTFNIEIQRRTKHKSNWYFIEKSQLINYAEQIRRFEDENPELISNSLIF